MNYRQETIGIVVDAARGGTDTGATGNGLVEKEVTLEISNYMQKRFQELNIPVKVTRESDTTLTDTERSEIILNAFVDGTKVIVLSNRLNSGGGEGTEVIYALRNTDQLARNIYESIGDEGQIMRKYYQRRLPEELSKDYEPIIRNTSPLQTVIIDYGFVDNEADSRRLKENIEIYAEAVVRAVTRYLGLPYTSPSGQLDNTYTVKEGDSIYSIANQFGISTEAILDVNNLSSNNLTIGQVLIIPRIDEMVTTTTPYTVQKGDSLYEIAKKFDTTVQAIVTSNDLTSNELSIGQILQIPNSGSSGMPTNDQIYTVQKGDSLYKIAQKFGVTVNDIIRANNLTTSDLQIGTQLLIPNPN